MEDNVGKDILDKAADTVKVTVDNVKDTVHEGQHRSAADAERAKRETLGNEMTPGEKVGSAVNEAKHRTQAEYDAVKRDVRERT
jgi:gas vesicle protein